MEFPHKLSLSDISALLGYPQTSLPAHCLEFFAGHSFAYRLLTQEERDTHMLRVVKRIEEEKLKRSTSENIAAFEQGWQENLDLCRAQGLSRENLRPKYVRPYTCIRFKSDYVRPQDPHMCDELLWLTVNWSFTQYFKDAPAVYEFGCGTGRYVYDLAQLFPQKILWGTDWTASSVQLLELMAASGLKVSGTRFDMMKPDSSFKLATGAGVLTVGALEQIGANFEPFLHYILEQKPAVVVHHEPIEDFYGDATLVDYLGLIYHRRRGYLHGYLGALRELESQGKIKILEALRVPFGDPFHESCSRIVWQPRSVR